MPHIAQHIARSGHEGLSAWNEVVSSLFFDMEMESDSASGFTGQAQHMDVGNLRLTRFQSSSAKYRRLPQHCDRAPAEILVSVPLTQAIEFEQLGRRIHCPVGRFLLEYSNAPYEFRNRECADMWVLKVPEAMLQSRVGSVTRFCAMEFDALEGVGRLFRDYVDLLGRSADVAEPKFQALMASQCADLLAAVLENDPRIVCSSNSAVKGAHMERIEQFIRQNFADPDLSPQKVASACRISVRYLHLLFGESGRTLSSWVRELRLNAAYEQFQRGMPGVSIAQTAYQFGFNDHAQFSNSFRKHFGRSPREVLGEARAAAPVRM